MISNKKEKEISALEEKLAEKEKLINNLEQKVPVASSPTSAVSINYNRCNSGGSGIIDRSIFFCQHYKCTNINNLLHFIKILNFSVGTESSKDVDVGAGDKMLAERCDDREV